MKSAIRTAVVCTEWRILIALLASVALLSGCKTGGDQIVVCGERFSIGTPVVLWSDPGGYDAYQQSPAASTQQSGGLAYRPGRSWADDGRPLDRRRLAEGVDLFVLHYDACGFSRRCFDVLQNKRGLSVHFMLDVDGTIYQTLDLREQAWHAREANPRSIGVEIANIGAYAGSAASPAASSDLSAAEKTPAAPPAELLKWYQIAESRLLVAVPPSAGDPQIRLPGPFHAARPDFVRGAIHGKRLMQADFTPQQYAALSKLAAGLHRALPRIQLDGPRDAGGAIRTDKLTRAEFDAFSGVIGHYHITTDKIDPGPAFDWDRFLREARMHAGDSPPPRSVSLR